MAHEALLRQWPPLRRAIEDSRHSLRLRSELERLVADWDQGRRDESYLLRGGRLATVDQWAGEHGGELGAVERQFLQASRTLAAQELAAARRSKRRRGIVGGLFILVLVLAVLATLAIQRNHIVQAQRRAALSRQLAAVADKLLDSRPETAVLVGLESLRVAPNQMSPAAGLVSSLARLNHASRAIRGFGRALDVAFSPDGKIVASGEGNHTVQLWEVATGRPHGPPLTGHTNAVTGVAFSPDGKLLASTSYDQTVRLWNYSFTSWVPLDAR